MAPVASGPPATAAVADACVRLGLPVRCGPAGLRPVVPGLRVAGPAVPARHAGSVDVFLEAMRGAPRGAILVVDNGGRLDEGCVGDLTALEARVLGLAGMAVWGLHRDTADLVRMRFPLWSLGTMPTGPLRLDARPADALAAARFGAHTVTGDDWVYADDDGVCLVAAAERGRVDEKARAIAATERVQAERAEAGTPLSSQFDLAGYVEARRRDPALTFRAHLRKRGGAIEE